MNQEKIGKFIAERRKLKKLTQVQLAEKLGVSDKSISKWETSKCMPDLSLFSPLCEILDITINDLMAGEKVDNKEYLNTLEKNIINMVVEVESKNKKKKKILAFLAMFIIVIIIGCRCVYFYHEIDVKFDKRVMDCEIKNNELIYNIKGQSVLNTYHTSKIIDGKTIYFFHDTINIYNKRRSNWEYSQSMAGLLDNQDVQFKYWESIEVGQKNVIVYYTDVKPKKIEKMSDEEVKKIINNSYLMCRSN